MKMSKKKDTVSIDEAKEESKLLASIGFTFGGVEVAADDDIACCKMETFTDGERYFIRQNISGQFFNFVNSGTGINEIRKRDKRLNRDVWSFKRVRNKEVFDLYRNFLKTKNQVHLRSAERIYQNG